MREIHFLLDHKDPFINHISGFFPLSEAFIAQNANYLNWDFLSLNEKLAWSIPFIDKFKDSWSWNNLSANESLPWSEEMIIEFAEKWGNREDQNDWSLIGNDSIKWTKSLISIFPEKIPGDWLAQRTELLNSNPELLEEFKEKLWWDYISGNEYMIWSEELIDKFINYWNWEILSANEAIHWTQALKDKYMGKYNSKYCLYGYPEQWINKKHSNNFIRNSSEDDDLATLYTNEELEKRIKLNYPGCLSSDERVPWSIDIIDRYIHEWDWDNLSNNKKLPWSEELIDRYLDKWDFGTDLGEINGCKSFTFGLSFNQGLPWSLKLLKKYVSKWDWKRIAYLDEIPWSLEILETFEDKWEWDRLIWNETMWQKVFYPYLDEEIMGAVLAILNKKV